jgi:tetratricopeptide (TPR) repeat protein
LSPTLTPQERLAYWSRFFEKEVKPETVQDVVADLVENRKYDDAISCIEQAILHSQIQPWMYQVLALSMQASGRPKAQIERVLLSSQDVILNDPRSMMHLAAYLVRFERFDRAIELYRQAAALDPSRPEAYVLALELAARTKNYTTIAWSAPEVLAFSWSKGRESLNRLAEQSAAEAEAAFLKSSDFASAVKLQTEMRNARRLDLAIRLEWSGQGDLDLRVQEPGGTVCSMLHPVTSVGGIFVHDGFGPVQEHCYEEYLCPMGVPGEYRAIVTHASGEIVGKRARLTIIRDRGTLNEESLTETIFLGPKDQSVWFSLGGGRRRAGQVEQQLGELKIGRNAGPQQTVLSQLAPGGGLGQIARGGGAVGFTPIITQIAEGVRMNAMATVSGDRRYVRINAQPIFSSITDVFTFTAQ